MAFSLGGAGRAVMRDSNRWIGGVALWLGALLVGFYFTTAGSDEPSASPVDVGAATVAPIQEAGSVAPTTEAGVSTSADPEASTTTLPTTTPPSTTTAAVASVPSGFEPPASGPWLFASLDDGRFALSGVVPDADTVAALTGAATLVYGPGAIIDVAAVAGTAHVDWLEGAQRGITLLPVIGEGSIGISNEGVAIAGRSPNKAQYDAFSQATMQILGVDAMDSAVEILDLGYPSFNARRIKDSVVLTGELANVSDQSRIVNGAIAVYGSDAVDDQTTVGTNLDTPFWTYTLPGVFQLLEPFPDYEINIVNGITSGSLNDGANFDNESSELNEATQALLGVAIAILTRDPTAGIIVAGHTDDWGDASFNQVLSERRAQATADFMIAAGIDPARIRTVGYGEERPMADNDTPEGRNSNRRVEFQFGPLVDILAAEL